MTGEVVTQLGTGGLIIVIVVRECFALLKQRRANGNGRYVSEKFCGERTKRIEESIKSSNALTQEKLTNISSALATRPCQKDCPDK